MTGLLATIRRASSGLLMGSNKLSSCIKAITNQPMFQQRHCSSYDPDPEYITQSPYRGQNMVRNKYKLKYFTGGLLPRPREFEDKPLPYRRVQTSRERDAWTPEKAHFGQNDYIDILGDGSLHPYQLTGGPIHLRGFRGDEMQRLIKQRNKLGTYLKSVRPAEYNRITQRLIVLDRKRNNYRRRHRKWGGPRSSSRLFSLDKW